jgi:uncharacterized protein (TIGR00369 family)
MTAQDDRETTVAFDRLCGLRLVSVSPEEVVAVVDVTEDHLQPFGLVHGGLFAAMAESTASLGTSAGVGEDGRTATGFASQTNFLRPILGGTVRATARRRHRGRSTWIWEVDITDDEHRLCGLVRMTIAVRDASPRRSAG